jgi:hypothetical protein
LEAHHQHSINNVIQYFKSDPEVVALLLGGSLAHGFAKADSDVDILIIVSDEAYQKRQIENRIHFFNRELCTYPGGYVDGKYHSPSYLNEVRARGSEPARFAFQDIQILFNRFDGLPELLTQIGRYPAEQQTERLIRFQAQLEAWHWYAQEASKKQNPYLLGLAVSKLTLFGGRLVLAHNQQLYPYHKWFLKVLADVRYKPDGIVEQLEQLCAQPTLAGVETFYNTIASFRQWPSNPNGWPVQFMFDSEWNWLTGPTPVDDL